MVMTIRLSPAMIRVASRPTIAVHCVRIRLHCITICIGSVDQQTGSMYLCICICVFVYLVYALFTALTMLKSRRDTGHDRGSCSKQSHFFQPRYVSHFYSYCDSYLGNFYLYLYFQFKFIIWNTGQWRKMGELTGMIRAGVCLPCCRCTVQVQLQALGV